MGDIFASAFEGMSSGWTGERLVRVRPDLEVGSALARVHLGVHVADDRVGERVVERFELGHGADVDHLVDGRHQRDDRPRHGRDLAAPDAAAHDDDLRLDVAAVVVTPVIRPLRTSSPVTSVLAKLCSAPSSIAFSR